jgi:hypothetical protein
MTMTLGPIIAAIDVHPDNLVGDWPRGWRLCVPRGARPFVTDSTGTASIALDVTSAASIRTPHGLRMALLKAIDRAWRDRPGTPMAIVPLPTGGLGEL